MLHPAANRHPKATHPWLLMGVQACRLPALKASKRSKPLKNLKPLNRCWLGNPPPMLWETLPPLTWHASSCSQQPPRGHTSMASSGSLKQSLGMLHPAANRHPKATHPWLLLGVQACRLPALKPSKRSKPLKSLKPLKRCWLGNPPPMLWETLPTLTWHASSCSQQPPRGHTSMASSGSLKQSLGMLHPAANRHPKATHPWLLLGVQACRLPALKPSKRSKPLKSLKPLKRCWLGNPPPMLWETLPTLTWHASSCSQQPPRGHTSMASSGSLKQSLGMLHPAANRHPKATHPWLLMGVQACRLPALKPSKRSKPLKSLKPLNRCWLGNPPPMLWETLPTLTWHASSCSQQPPRGHTSMASSGSLKQSLGMLHPAANRHPKATHPWLLLGVQACRLPALKPSKRSKPLKSLKPLNRCWLGNPPPMLWETLPTLTWHASSLVPGN